MSDEAPKPQPDSPDKQATESGSERPGRGGVIPPKAARFRPGKSGNPGGRAKGPRSSPTAALRRFSGMKLDRDGINKLLASGTLTIGERIGLSTALRAITREGKALEIAYDRLDGKVPTFNVDSTMDELSRFTDEEIDAVITGRFHRRTPDSE